MHILIIARGYPTEKYKMNGIFEFDQAKALVQAGHKVIYAAVDVRSIRRWRKWGFESLNKEGVRIEAVNIPGGRIPKSILCKMRIWGLKKLYDRIEKKYGKVDIMHAHFTSSGFAAAKLASETNLPLVITEHYSGINKKAIDRSLFDIAEYAYNHADALIAVSPTFAEVITENFKKNVFYIPNVIDTDLFLCTPRINDGKYNFVSVGNLIPSKRMDLTMTAFYKAFRDIENVTLTIFGAGSEKGKLDALIKEYKLDDKMVLKGLQPRSEIAKHLNKSDCFVLASRSETFGVAYAEALSAGVPVIATNCGGPEEFVHKDNGILIEVDDIQGLTDAMLKMYSESDKFNREKISKEIVDKFSPETIAKRLTEIYRNILKDRRVQR